MTMRHSYRMRGVRTRALCIYASFVPHYSSSVTRRVRQQSYKAVYGWRVQGVHLRRLQWRRGAAGGDDGTAHMALSEGSRARSV